MLDTLLGNAALKRELGTALAAGRLPHALLLVGEPGCGAGFAARCLAADYLFPQGGGQARALMAGQACQVLGEGEGSVETGVVREALELRPAGKAGMIRVSQIRMARQEMFKSSLSAEGRVVLLYGAQAMNQGAANAFLKILEEPPQGALFLLTATSLAAVLPTIRSRCAAYTLSPVSVPECREALARALPGLDGAEAAFLARVYGGKVGSCLQAAKPPRRQGLANAQALANALAQGQEYQALAQLAAVEKDKPAARLLAADLSALCAAALRDPTFRPTPDGPALSPARAMRILQAVPALLQALDGNVNTRLALTLFGAQAAQ